MVLRPDTFEGSRFTWTKPVNESLLLDHNLSLGGETPGYSLGGIFVGPGVQMNARVDGDATMQGLALFHTAVGASRLEGRVDAALSDRGNHVLCRTDWIGADWCGSATLSPNEQVQEYGLSYFQSVTQRLALGIGLTGAVVTQDPAAGPQVMADYRVAAQYKDDNSVSTLDLHLVSTRLGMSYAHRVSSQIMLATDLEIGPGQQQAVDATAKVGWQYDLQAALVRGTIASNGSIRCTYQQHLMPGINFDLSATVDHQAAGGGRSPMRFGFGLSL